MQTQDFIRSSSLKILQRSQHSVTSFGRYCFTRFPFGIRSGPEIFQREISKVRDGIEGVVCVMDDTVRVNVFGSTHEEYDKCLHEVLTKLRVSSLTLNKGKCRFRESEIGLLG